MRQPINLTRVVTLHYTTWCKMSNHMRPVWDQVKNTLIGSGIVFQEVDEDTAPSPNVNSYPTIIMVNEHGRTSQYAGRPEYNQLLAWITTPAQHEQI